MKKHEFKMPEKKFRYAELPGFVIDETNKTIFLSLFMVALSIMFTIKMRSPKITLVVLILICVYALIFYFCFYRHFAYDNLLVYDGYVTYYDGDNTSGKNIVRQFANRYIRKCYTVEVPNSSDNDSFILKTFVKGVKLKNDMKVRLYVIPDSILKNRDNSYNVSAVYVEILQTPNKKKGKK